MIFLKGVCIKELISQNPII